MKKHILSVSIFNTVRNFTVYLHSPCILGESKWIPKRLHAIGDTWTGSKVGIIPHSHRRKEKRKQWEERMREEREKPREREAVKREKNVGRGKLSSLIGEGENRVKSMCLYTSFLPNCSHCPLWQQQCELKTGKVVHCWYFICLIIYFPQHVGSSQVRDQTHVPCIGWQILNHRTTREVQDKAF